MKTDFRLLANQPIRETTPYQPGKPIEELERELGIQSSIKLASNENPLGPSHMAVQAAQRAALNAHIYPDGSCYELKEILCKQLQVSADQLTIGNGSENILELICKAYLNTTSNAVVSEYAFITIPLLVKGYGANVNLAKATNWGHDIDNMLSAVDDNTKIVFLVNPNNPTGTYTNDSDIKKLLDNLPSNIIVVIDEAYSEYITQQDYPDSLELLKNYPNIIISRTFSKAYGLAALRLGYALASPDISDMLNRARLPFNVNSIAIKAGCAALLDQEHILKSVAVNNAGMQQVTQGLQDMNLDYIPSLGNFVTVNVSDGAKVYDALLHEGVIVRPLAGYNMPQHIRVTIGTKEENERFLTSLKTVITNIKETA